MLVAGEETKESLSTWARAAAAAQQSSSEREGSERETGGGKEEEVSGRKGSRRKGKQTAKKKTHGPLVGRFSVSLKICVFLSLPFKFLFFLSLLIFYSY